MIFASSLATTWPPGRPRILVADAWLANAGDAALAIATDVMIREAVPKAAVLHAAYHSAELAPCFPQLRFTAPLERLIGTPWAPPALEWAKLGPALVSGADAVISQGGGFLMEAYQPWGRIAALATVARCGIPLAILGQTIDRFVQTRARNELHQVMRAAALVAGRDPPSVLNAVDLGATDVILGADLALVLFPDPPQKRTRRGVGLVLTDHHPDPDRRAQLAEVAQRVAKTTIERSRDEVVTLWSTVQGHPELAGEDDAALAEVVCAGLSPTQRARVEVIEGYVSPEKAIALVGGSRALVSMRMHPALFAAALDTPFSLVLGGQKAEVLSGSSLRDHVVDPVDQPAVDRAVVSLIGSESGSGQWMALAPLRLRLRDVQSRLTDFLHGLPSAR